MQSIPQPQPEPEPIDPLKTLPRETLIPKPIDLDFIKTCRNNLINQIIAERIDTLCETIPTLEEGSEEKLSDTIEYKKLSLLEYQKQLRKEVLESEIAKTSKSNKSKSKEKQRLEQQQSEEKNRYKDFLGQIMNHSKEFKEFHANKMTRIKKMTKRVTNYFVLLEKKEQQQREKEERERLRALKTNDESKYLKLLEQTKNQRLRELFDQTNEFLDKISHLLQREKVSIIEQEENEEAAHSYYSKAHSILEDIIEQPQILEGGKLKPYQMQGLQWMVSLYNNKLNGILADEMGLGKTIQTIALVSYLIEVKKNNGPYLVVVPLSTLTNWGQEFAKWAPKIKAVLYYGDKPTRKSRYEEEISPGQFNVVVTTYEYIIKDKNQLCKIKWNYLIIDEGHRMKNYTSKLSVILGTNYHSRYRLLLTGTPLQNSLPELWALLNFLLPNIFDCVEDFEQWFNAPFAQTGEKIEMNEEEQLLIIQRLHKVLRPFLLRRLKKEVEAQLPDKVEKVLKCDMSAFQQKMYDLIKDKGFTAGSGLDGNPKLAKGLKNTYVQLRKICNHPYLFYDEEYPIDDNLIRYAGKFDLLDRLLPKLKAAGHRVLIFSQMTQLINILEVFFAYRDFKYLRLDGSTKSEERGPLLQLFNAPNSEYFIFVLSTRAGGLGLNLQTADTVIIFDSDWNPQMDLQAQDRAHRIGQKQTVRVLRLVTLHSVEENILARANFKKELDKKIIQAGQFNNKSNRSDRKKMLEDLMTQDETAEMERQTVPSDSQINEMIARSPEEFELYEQMDKERMDRDSQRWKELGKEGEPKRLCQENEMPPWITKEVEVTDDLSFVLNPSSVKGKKNQEESERQILRMMENGEIARRRRTTTNIAEYFGDDDEDSSSSESDSDFESSTPSKRGRKSKDKDGDHSMNGNNNNSLASASVETPSKKRKDLDIYSDYEDDNADEEDDEDTPRPQRSKKKAKTQQDFEDERSNGSTPSTPMSPISTSSSTTAAIPGLPGPSPAKKAGRGRPAGTLKKKPTTENDMKYLQLWDSIRMDQDEEGRRRSEIFQKLPSKRDYPDYYTIIRDPIDMKTIKEKIVASKYHNPTQFAQSVNQMFYNAQIYNQSGSEVFEDAVVLQNLFTNLFNSLFPNNQLPKPEPPLSPSTLIGQKSEEIKDPLSLSNDNQNESQQPTQQPQQQLQQQPQQQQTQQPLQPTQQTSINTIVDNSQIQPKPSGINDKSSLPIVDKSSSTTTTSTKISNNSIPRISNTNSPPSSPHLPPQSQPHSKPQKSS
ncbi:hypothetical protein DICPUDRAFT_55110, partial [Dictyostelium purpureum]